MNDESVRLFPLADGFSVAVGANGPVAIYRDGQVFGSKNSELTGYGLSRTAASFQAYTNYSRSIGTGFGIIKAKVLVTGACNQRCYYCAAAANWQIRGLSTSEIFCILAKLAEAGVVLLQLQGGEVSVRNDLVSILQSAEQNRMYVEFFTNGSGPVWRRPSTFDAIAALKLQPGVVVSLLAGEESLHDRLAGLRGAFRMALKTARRLKETGCCVRLSISLSKETISQLSKAAQIADSLNVPLSIITELYPSIGGIINTGALAATPKDIELARHDVFGDVEVQLAKQSCTAGITSVTVDHEGFVVGCEQNTRARFGSLLSSSLREICQSPEYQQYMEGFYRRPPSCDICPDELSRFCNWCPATALNIGIAQDGWLDFHCGVAMRRRLFWTGRRSPVEGSRPAAQNAFSAQA